MTLPRNVLSAVLSSALSLVLALAAFIVTVSAASPASGTTAFTVSGTRALHDPPFPDQLLPGYFTGTTISHIDYPAALFGMDRSIAVAVRGLDDGVRDSREPVIAAGFSQGALAVAHAKKELMALPEDQRPAADRLSFLTIGDPSGAGGILKKVPFRIPLIGLTPLSPPDTPYDTVIVNGEYDGWADFPDRPWRLVSLANALLGIVYVHGGYETIPGGLDLSTVPPAGITTSVNVLGGTTTTYLLPTPRLPLVQPLRDIGVSERIVIAIEKPLRKAVDKGYTRNDAAKARVRAGPRQIRQPERRADRQTHGRSPVRSVA